MKTVHCVSSGGLLAKSALLVTTLALSSCGEQDPAFTEQGAGASELNKDGITQGGAGGSGDSTAETGSGSTGSSGGGTGGRAGAGDDDGGSGGEVPSNLLLADESSTLTIQNKVDILWVVDSSGSMSEEQNYLGTNFGSFITQLAASNADFQTGITTTDICSDTNPAQVPLAERYCPTLDDAPSARLRGSLVGNNGKKVLKPSTSDLVARFKNYANVGTNGSGFEHGLKAAEMAVTKSLAGQNEGLVRNDAFLAVIVVSDEEDDGIGLGITDAYFGRNYVAEGLTSVHYTDSHLISYLNGVKGSGNFSVSTITGTRNANGSMCSSAHSQPQEEGTQYIAAANKTGGIVQSICDTNWSNSLANIGQDIAAQSAQVALAHTPYSGTLKVYVNGVENFDWTYNSGNNSVKFTAGHIPASGSTVSTKYWYAP